MKIGDIIQIRAGAKSWGGLPLPTAGVISGLSPRDRDGDIVSIYMDIHGKPSSALVNRNDILGVAPTTPDPFDACYYEAITNG